MGIKNITDEVNELREHMKNCNKIFDDSDMINNPKHYNSADSFCDCGRQIQCIDVTRPMGFSLGNVVKYLWRAEHKDGLVALKKAQWYLNDYIKNLERD